MSLLKYIESKKSQVNIITDSYRDKLSADAAHLLIRPTEKLEIKKDAINVIQLERYLTDLKYPLKNEFLMAVKTGDPKKIASIHKFFKNWHDKSESFYKVEEIIYDYQSNLYKKEICPKTVDQLIEAYLSESENVLEQIQNYIKLKLPLDNYVINITAIPPEQGWIVSEASVEIQGILNFVCEKKDNEFIIKNIQETTVRGKRILDKLLKKENEAILTLYMNCSKGEKQYFERIKRDLSLGIISTIPANTVLTPEIIGEDVWKVKIERKFLKEHNGQYVLIEESPVRWLELIKESNEK